LPQDNLLWEGHENGGDFGAHIKNAAGASALILATIATLSQGANGVNQKASQYEKVVNRNVVHN
jgi:hypothetical protein